ncbi:hypothetical protein FACS1894110_20010 [Spirochaetia bacterium]|nr:hypothetical protein FACS1894110_20010 [Spirochaetia bacterium]
MDKEQTNSFQFEKIALLDDRSVQKILREVDSPELVMALKGADADVQDKIFRNMSKRAAAALKERLDCMGPVRAKDVEEARQKIIAIIRLLEDTGEIVAARDDGEPVVDTQLRKSTIEEQTAELIEQIEGVIQKSGYLSFYCQNPACVSNALAAFENRTEDLRRIRELALDTNCLEAAQPLLRLGTLEKLTVYKWGKPRDLPESIRACSGLKYLQCDIQNLPEWIGDLTALETLNLNNSMLGDLFPSSILNLSALKSLNLGGTNLSELPEWIGRFVSLETLDLSGTKITALPQGMRNLATLENLNIRNTRINYLPEWIADLAGLKIIDIHETDIKDIPAVFTQNKNISILQEYEFMPDHELNHDEFVHCYYYIVRKSVEYSEKARREGLLALEEWLDDMGNNDLFKAGLRMVLDGTDYEAVQYLLSNLVEREHDPYRRILKQVQAEAIYSIQAGDSTSHLLLRLNSMVDIPDNKVNAICAGYYSGGSFDIDEALDKIGREPPPEREEIRFMRRALAFAEKARREGLLALEGELDSALFAARDVFEYGIAFVIDGEEAAFIKTILDALIAHEHDPWKRKLLTVKRDAALSIQAGDNPRILAAKMLSHFDKSIEDMAKAELLRD